MDSVETAPPSFMDDLLNFGSDLENDAKEDPTRASLGSALLTVLLPEDPTRSFVDSPLMEEELEWISNKEAFPAVETFSDFLSNQEIFNSTKQCSPTSVLETPTITTSTNSSTSITCNDAPCVPVKARSKRHRKQQQKQSSWWRSRGAAGLPPKLSSTLPIPIIGRKCQHCGVEKTPQWRAGPLGVKTLCNACGVRFKSGRLVPEYRPANSPTFCSELHSNSHRKVLEMRRRKQIMGLPVVKPMDQDVR